MKIQLLTKSAPRKAGNAGSFKEFAHSGVKQNYISRAFVHSIFQEIRAFNSPYAYFAGNLCLQELKILDFQHATLLYFPGNSRAQSTTFPGDLCIQELKMPHGSLCLQGSSNTTFSKGTYAFEGPKRSEEFVPPRAHDTTFLGICAFKRLQSPPLL